MSIHENSQTAILLTNDEARMLSAFRRVDEGWKEDFLKFVEGAAAATPQRAGPSLKLIIGGMA